MTFLYNLMGLSAFAGVLCLVIGSPLNSYLARRSVRIQKGLLAARDKRMGVVNEVVTSVKFIKFFAWEDKWIGRVDDARKHEIKWLTEGEKSPLMYRRARTLMILSPVFSSAQWSLFEFTVVYSPRTRFDICVHRICSLRAYTYSFSRLHRRLSLVRINTFSERCFLIRPSLSSKC
jgi:hypothetical protein